MKNILVAASSLTLVLIVMLFASAPASAANLIINGDFSLGLSNWSETNSCCYYVDASGFHEGAVGTNGMLSQTFADTLGALLTVDFDYGGNSGYQYLSFNNPGVNNVVGSLVNNPSSYQHYTFTLGVATGSDTITFDGRNDPSYNTLDNVVVTESAAAVPEPTSLLLLGTGLAGIALAALRRKKA